MDGFASSSKSMINETNLSLRNANMIYHDLGRVKWKSRAISDMIDELLTALDKPLHQLIQQFTARVNRMFGIDAELKTTFLNCLQFPRYLQVLRSWGSIEGYRGFYMPLPPKEVNVPGDVLFLSREVMRIIGQEYVDYVGFYADDRISRDG